MASKVEINPGILDQREHRNDSTSNGVNSMRDDDLFEETVPSKDYNIYMQEVFVSPVVKANEVQDMFVQPIAYTNEIKHVTNTNIYGNILWSIILVEVIYLIYIFIKKRSRN